jgi:exodeoxyribonuclease VII small subunit
MPRRKSATEDPAAPSFEESLAGLEALVEAMEKEQLPLEELVVCYEKGSVLLDRCESLLQSARGRIELITLRNQTEIENGTDSTSDFSLPTGTPDASDDDHDIRLF